MHEASRKLARVDNELFSIARTSVGSEQGLTPAQSARLRGQIAKELYDDARAIQGELGMETLDDPPRDQGGRYAKTEGIYDNGGSSNARFNQLMRAVAGR